MTNPKHQVADAIRLVALRLEHSIERGKTTISAEDLLQTLLSIADNLDPPCANDVDPESACPGCGERKSNRLLWRDDDSVRCTSCGVTYEP